MLNNQMVFLHNSPDSTVKWELNEIREKNLPRALKDKSKKHPMLRDVFKKIATNITCSLTDNLIHYNPSKAIGKAYISISVSAGPLQQLRMPRPPTLHNEPKIVAGRVDQNPRRRCKRDEWRVLAQSL